MTRAGCVPFRRKKGKVQYLKVRGSKGGWVFPAGRVKRGESRRKAAQREAFEEAGVQGDIVGKVRTRKGNVYFLLDVKKQKPSPEKRKKRWVSSKPHRLKRCG
ncbi:MAG: NUDIX domain-containing protein [Henriciella sp.]|jgi:8-oxo-dGTP pyrophosphatase MutT (NUDIX family)